MAYLAKAANHILEVRQLRTRTTVYCAPAERVLSLLEAEGVEVSNARKALAALRDLGYVDRTEFARGSLALSGAGEAWILALNAQAEVDNRLTVDEVVDNAVRKAIEELGRPASNVPPRALAEWVGGELRRFQLAVANTDLCRALWIASDRPQDEKAVQAVVHGFLNRVCAISGVDLSREVDAGNGPVDMKLSIGPARVLVEVKLLANQSLAHGARRQLPRYLQGEEAACG